MLPKASVLIENNQKSFKYMTHTPDFDTWNERLSNDCG